MKYSFKRLMPLAQSLCNLFSQRSAISSQVRAISRYTSRFPGEWAVCLILRIRLQILEIVLPGHPNPRRRWARCFLSALPKAERDLVLATLKQCGNNRVQTAKLLGMAAIDVRQEIEAICLQLWPEPDD
jgi:hypothetical protein